MVGYYLYGRFHSRVSASGRRGRPGGERRAAAAVGGDHSAPLARRARDKRVMEGVARCCDLQLVRNIVPS